MEQNGRRRNSLKQHHQAVDGLLNFFTKSQHDLSYVHNKLEREFQLLYPDNANPMKLVGRIKKLEEDLLLLNDQCRELLVAKQDLIDKASTILVSNRSMIHRMQTSAGILPTTSDSDDPAYTNFKEVIDEWTTHVRSRAVNDQQDEEEEDINKLIFSSIQ